MVTQCPLVYMWIAHFSDGKVLPQFDPNTYKENKWSEAEEYPSRIKKISLYPIPPDIAHNTSTLAKSVYLPKYEVTIPKKCSVINLRRGYIEYTLGGRNKKVKIEKRWRIYIIGWKTNDGEYSLMFIDEEGNVELHYNFEYNKEKVVN